MSITKLSGEPCGFYSTACPKKLTLLKSDQPTIFLALTSALIKSP
jgi:hypothetical protein